MKKEEFIQRIKDVEDDKSIITINLNKHNNSRFNLYAPVTKIEISGNDITISNHNESDDFEPLTIKYLIEILDKEKEAKIYFRFEIGVLAAFNRPVDKVTSIEEAGPVTFIHINN